MEKMLISCLMAAVMAMCLPHHGYAQDQLPPTLQMCSGIHVNHTDNTKLVCLSNGQPKAPIKVQHQRSKKVFQLEDLNINHTTLMFGEKVEKLSCRDAGVYSFWAENEEGKSKKYDVPVNKKCKPELKNSKDEGQTHARLIGAPYPIEARIYGYPHPDKFALKKESKSKKEDEYTVTYKEVGVGEGVVSLVIHNLQSANDSGKYQLDIGNEVGSFQYTLDLVVVDYTGGSTRAEVDDNDTDNDSVMTIDVSTAIVIIVFLVSVILAVVGIIAFLVFKSKQGQTATITPSRGPVPNIPTEATYNVTEKNTKDKEPSVYLSVNNPGNKNEPAYDSCESATTKAAQLKQAEAGTGSMYEQTVPLFKDPGGDEKGDPAQFQDGNVYQELHG